MSSFNSSRSFKMDEGVDIAFQGVQCGEHTTLESFVDVLKESLAPSMFEDICNVNKAMKYEPLLHVPPIVNAISALSDDDDSAESASSVDHVVCSSSEFGICWHIVISKSQPKMH